MSNSETAFQPTIEDFRAFLTNESENYSFRCADPTGCPIYWYLHHRGMRVLYVSHWGYDHRTNNGTYESVKYAGDYMWMHDFAKCVDGDDPDMKYLYPISAQECLDILENL